ncbi:MAG: PIN domain-containing protein [Chloroflexi bacterium]|nr:PIN domain-containing protein [Chloroflexota bacterium]
MKVRAFLDTSALFSVIWPAEGGARMILRLSEAGAINLLVSSLVLRELENALRRKALRSLGSLALLLDKSNLEVSPNPKTETIEKSLSLTHHPGDANILAAAWESNVDFLVTLDRKHFLENKLMSASVPFPIGTPGDFLAWYRRHLNP